MSDSGVTSDLFESLQAAVGEAYRLTREITGGGMSRLFLAVESSLERQVVIKVLPPDFTSSVSSARFKREMELTAHLQHPHILPVLSAGAKNDLLYYVMPYISGESLRHRLERDGPLPISDACRILREVTDALSCAHAEGIVHRDIKPENILLQGSHALLADFGIAGALAAARGGTADLPVPTERLTGTGMSVGTPGYMAPEQLAGERDVDARADIYSLGMVGYEMLAGERPFAGLSGSALLVARLTETPPPILEVRPDTPPDFALAITIALSTQPEARFQWASELHDLLESVGPIARSARETAARTSAAGSTGIPVVRTPGIGIRTATVSGAARAARRRIGPRALAIGGLTLALAAAGVIVRVWKGGGALTPNLVAVAPFNVPDTDLELWKEGLVDILSRNFDGAGDFRSVSPTVIVGSWSGRADKDNARKLGRKSGASYVIYGSLFAKRGDSVQIRADLVDVATGVNVGDGVTLFEAIDRLDVLADAVTVQLLTALGQQRAVAAFRGTTLGSSSLPALKAFLQGEQSYRRTAWDSAITYYERAVSLDSTFALALRRYGLAVSWQRAGADSLSLALRLRAGAFNRRLSPRDSLLTLADSIGASLGALARARDTTEGAYTRRMFATLRTTTQRYPGDPEAWYALADAHMHYFAPGEPVTDEYVMRAFDRAIALDPSFAPAYIHAVELRLSLSGADSALKYARTYLALNPTDVEAEGIRLVARLIDRKTARTAATSAILDTISEGAIATAWNALKRWPDSAETAVRLARILAGENPGGREILGDTATWRRRLATQLAYRGHVREAYKLIGSAPTRLFSELAVFGAVPADTARAVFARSLGGGAGDPRAATPWWSAQRDTASLSAFGRRADSLGTSGTPAQRREGRYGRATARAYLALVRGDTTVALVAFATMPDTLCWGCYADRLMEARLLLARGQAKAALVMVQGRLPVLLSPSEVLFALQRGRSAEKDSRKKEAIAAYRSVRDTWLNADPELRPQLEEARGALRRLERGG
ncbi:MAG: serine/threonine-protein kinase [Gemmatimonadaceae bacterium]